MAPRTSWKGFLKLSLVSVPVKAFTAHDTSGEVRLNQLHRDCHSRIRYQKVCPEHGEVKTDEIVSGYEYAKGEYVVIDPGELAKMRSQSDQTVKIDGFIPGDAIEPRYYAGKSYYLTPDGVAGGKAYALLYEGMEQEGLHAIGQVVLSGREQLVLIRPVEDLLVMTVVNHAQKVKKVDEFRDLVEHQELTEEEMALTKTLISASTLGDFQLNRYKDDYYEQLNKLIQMRLDGKEVVQAPDHEEPKILNLMEALKKSVAGAQAQKAPSGKATTRKASQGKKMAPSTRKRAAAKKKSG